jgi:hypothetical protein
MPNPGINPTQVPLLEQRLLPDFNVQNELSLLRQEVKQLRADLFPPATTLLTGRAVTAEFERLTKPRR